MATNYLSSEPIVGILGGLPVAEQTQDYFLVFQQTGDTSPEIIDETAYFITYLVQSDGTISKPAEDTVALSNLKQNFPVGKNATVRLDQGTALNTGIDGLQEITHIGTQQTILFTQTGFLSSSYATSSLSFKLQTNPINSPINLGIVPDYRGSMIKYDDTPLSGDTLINNFNTINVTPSPSASFSTANGTYQITPNSLLDSLQIRAELNIANSADFGLSAVVRLEMDRGSGYNTIGESYEAIEGGATGQSALLITDVTGVNLTNGGQNPKFRVRVSGNSALTVTYAKLRVPVQNPQGAIFVTASTAQDLWQTGSGIASQWLTASQFLSINYGNTQEMRTIEGVIDEEYTISPPPVPFTVKKGDIIRFEYNKFKEFKIYDVIEPGEDQEGLLKVRVNKEVPDNTLLSNFVLHRVDINAPSYIILNARKNNDVDDTQNFSGLILPEYPTPRLIENLDEIIVNLKERGIIVDNLN